VNAREGIELIRAWLLDPNILIVGHNLWFDLGVCVVEDPSLLPLVFDKLENGLAADTMVRQQLIDIALGELKFHFDEDTGELSRSSYHLNDLSYRLLKRYLQKEDTWRLKYALLDGVSLTEWPEEAVRYSLLDSIVTLDIFRKQGEIAGGPITNSAEQHRAAWALYLMSVWGIRTDPVAVAELRKTLEHEFAEKMLALRPSGLFRIIPVRALKSGPRKGTVIPEEVTKNMKVIRDKVAAAYATKGLPVPMTEPDNEDAKPSVSTSRKTLKDTGEKDLIALAEVGVTGKLLQTYVPVLEGGTSVPINARYNVLLETGRTSCSKPNLQNPPRTGKVRECFVARPGWVFGFADYSGLELATLAQVCLDVLGRSEMAEALRRGEDLHLALGADMLGVLYEEAKKRSKAGDQEIKFYRQQAKPANFGFPGGMGPDAFREYSEAYGITLSSAQAQELKDAWFRKWPEMRAYFQWITWLTEQTDPTTGEAKPVAQIRSGRLRGGATYCATANGMFQGLAADGAKEATWLVARECYLERPWEKVPDPTSGKTHSERTPLFGCRPSLFIHDEIGMEIPYPVGGESTASAAVERLSSVMVAAMKRWVPDVPIKAEPVMVRRWYKGAEIVRREDGVILPSKPVIEIGADGKKKTKWVADL
jgi:hypothetical protein